MKYTINAINQLGIQQAGLADKTDLVDWVILDYLFELNANPSISKIDGYFLVDYQKIKLALPLLGNINNSEITNRLCNLEKLGLVNHFVGNGYLHLRITPLYFKTLYSQGG